MGLLQNIRLTNAEPLRRIGDTSEWFPSCLNWQQNKYVGYAELSRIYGIPSGYLHPTAWLLPVSVGGMAATSTIRGNGVITKAQIAAGRNLRVQCDGFGTIANPAISAIADLIISIAGVGGFETNPVIIGGINAVCNMYGVGAITANIWDGITRENLTVAFAGTSLLAASIANGQNLSVNITGEGSLEANIQAIADMTVEITGSASMNMDISAIADLAVEISTFTELSPQSLAANVWNAVADAYNTSGSMGNKLNLASSGGVDYDALAQAVWEYENYGEMLVKVLKICGNNADYQHPILTIYEDDGVTIFRQYDLSRKGRILQ